MTTEQVLHVRDLHGWYGESHVLHGIDFSAGRGEVVALLGRNGAGKSTTLRAIIGILARRKGSIRVRGQETIDLPAREIGRMGVGYVPEERGIFGTLTVRENLLLPPILRPGGFALDEIYQMFPNLKTRLSSPGGRLSGGEQQMLAIARIIRTGADCLLLDEPTEGLAPVIVAQIGRTVELLKERGCTVILVEQNLKFATKVADRHYVIEQGRVVDEFDRAGATEHSGRLRGYLGV
ncbi:MAG: transporter ATP-binding protein [Ramlibacter sp.]|nr:transporter ATP-binding protein [Ramlibacter sp.]